MNSSEKNGREIDVNHIIKLVKEENIEKIKQIKDDFTLTQIFFNTIELVKNENKILPFLLNLKDFKYFEKVCHELSSLELAFLNNNIIAFNLIAEKYIQDNKLYQLFSAFELINDNFNGLAFEKIVTFLKGKSYDEKLLEILNIKINKFIISKNEMFTSIQNFISKILQTEREELIKIIDAGKKSEKPTDIIIENITVLQEILEKYDLVKLSSLKISDIKEKDNPQEKILGKHKLMAFYVNFIKSKYKDIKVDPKIIKLFLEDLIANGKIELILKVFDDNIEEYASIIQPVIKPFLLDVEKNIRSFVEYNVRNIGKYEKFNPNVFMQNVMKISMWNKFILVASKIISDDFYKKTHFNIENELQNIEKKPISEIFESLMCYFLRNWFTLDLFLENNEKNGFICLNNKIYNITKLLGKGSFSRVFLIKNAFVNSDEFILSVKLNTQEEKYMVERAINMNNLLGRLIDYGSIKTIMVNKRLVNEPRYVLILKPVLGKELNDDESIALINQSKYNFLFFAHKLFKWFNDNMFNHGLLHNDISLRNIIVDVKNNLLFPQAIDFDTSSNINYAYKIIGAIPYQHPSLLMPFCLDVEKKFILEYMKQCYLNSHLIELKKALKLTKKEAKKLYPTLRKVVSTKTTESYAIANCLLSIFSRDIVLMQKTVDEYLARIKKLKINYEKDPFYENDCSDILIILLRMISPEKIMSLPVGVDTLKKYSLDKLSDEPNLQLQSSFENLLKKEIHKMKKPVLFNFALHMHRDKKIPLENKKKYIQNVSKQIEGFLL